MGNTNWQAGMPPIPPAAPASNDANWRSGIVPASGNDANWRSGLVPIPPGAPPSAPSLLDRMKNAWQEWSQYDTSHSIPRIANDLLTGAVKGGLHTIGAFDDSAIAQKFNELFESPQTLARQQAEYRRLETPTNPGQNLGFGTEQTGEFFIPAEGEAKAAEELAKTAKAARDAGEVGRVGEFALREIPRMAIDAGVNAGIAAAHGNNWRAAGEQAALLPLGLQTAGETVALPRTLSNFLRSRMGINAEQAMADGFTPLELAQHAEAEGIRAMPAHIVGGSGLRDIHSIGENALLGGQELLNHVAAARSDLGNSLSRFADRVQPELTNTLPQGELDAGEAGRRLQEALRTGADLEGRRVNGLFDQLDELSHDAKVRPSMAREKLMQIFSRFRDRARFLPSLMPRGTSNVLADLDRAFEFEPESAQALQAAATPEENTLARLRAQGEWDELPDESRRFLEKNGVSQQKYIESKMLWHLDDPDLVPARLPNIVSTQKLKLIPWRAAQDMRSALLKAGELPGDAVVGEGPAAMRELANAVDEDMTRSARQLTPELEEHFRQANEAHRARMEEVGKPQSTLYQALQAQKPETVGQMLLSPSNGGSVSTLEAMKKYLNLLPGADRDTAMADLQREFLRRLGDNGNGVYDRGRFLTNLMKYSDNYLGRLFQPEQLSELRGIGKREFIQDLLNPNENHEYNLGLAPGRFSKYSSEELQKLGFDDSQTNWLRRHMALLRRVNENYNPSATGKLLLKARQLFSIPMEMGGLYAHNPYMIASGLTPIATETAAAKIARSPAVLDWALDRNPGALARFLRKVPDQTQPYGRLARFLTPAAGAAGAQSGN